MRVLASRRREWVLAVQQEGVSGVVGEFEVAGSVSTADESELLEPDGCVRADGAVALGAADVGVGGCVEHADNVDVEGLASSA